jgi:hypothetical protein
MPEERTFVVTMVRVGPGLPYFEVDAYRYTAAWLPAVGDLITITRASSTDTGEPTTLLAYVTRVDPTADTPIRVTEAKGVATAASADEYIVAA